MSAANIHSDIINGYGNDRRKCESERRRRAGEVYSLIPRIRTIDDEISSTSIGIVRTLASKDTDGYSEIKLLREKTQRLNEEKSSLLAANGFPQNYLEPVYVCSLCKDTGFTNGSKCACYLRRLIEKHTEISGLSPLSRSETFDVFDFGYYSADKDKAHGISPLENIKMVHGHCRNFSESFPSDSQSLYMYGGAGLGKTFLCNCIANRLLYDGHSVMYFTALNLFKLFESKRFSADDYGIDEAYKLVFSCDLLIIDDLGTEFSTIVTDTEFFNVINIRLINSKPVIISTNLGFARLKNDYSERISSRIIGNYLLLEFFGEDIREKKKYG